jgi:hypothetical protein
MIWDQNLDEMQGQGFQGDGTAWESLVRREFSEAWHVNGQRCWRMEFFAILSISSSKHGK